MSRNGVTHVPEQYIGGGKGEDVVRQNLLN